MTYEIIMPAVQSEPASRKYLHNRSSDINFISEIDARKLPEYGYSLQQWCQLDRGHHLFRSGDIFYGFYIIRSGSVKTYRTSVDGYEQVTGFYFPGDIVGLDSIQRHCHPSTADALELTTVYMIPFDSRIGMEKSNVNMHKLLLHALSVKITNDKKHLLLLCDRYAESRLAAFLLELSDIHHNRGFSAHEFNLTMNRCDIGNYIGLTAETTSRLFTHFKKRGLIRVQRRAVSIMDPEALRQLSLESKNALRVERKY